MQIKKRSGALEEYNFAKITGAIKKAFLSVGQQVGEAVLADLLAGVESRLPGGEISVEQIQDLVERVMMEQGHYDAAKSYSGGRTQSNAYEKVPLCAALNLADTYAAHFRG